MKLEGKFAKADGVGIHYLDWGGEGPPVVMVHASSFCADVWAPIAEALSQSYHVVSIDQRGHGDSDKPSGPYKWENFGKDLVGFLETLSLKDAIAIGHSTGGTHVILAAAEKPGLIQKAVLFEPTIWSHRDYPGGRRPRADGVLKRRRMWDNREQIFKSYRPRYPFSGWREDVVHAYIEGGFRSLPNGKVELKCPPEIEAEVYQNVSDVDAKEFLPRIACPVLWIVGQDSPPWQRISQEYGARLVKNCRLVYVPRTTHFIPMEKPEESTRLIRKFLEGERPAKRSR